MEPAAEPGSGSGSGLELPPSQSQFTVSPPDITTPSLTVDATTDSQHVEVASPISSRPPASSSLNYEEIFRLSTTVQMPVVGDDEGLAGDDADRTTGSSGAGNRWPRQETLALLRIRSDMDSAFRDATLKGPLWDEVSRKLTELGYNRSAKKCKEKFENVQKYYKRTKEGRGGRQDGKTYKFFTQLEALHNASASASASAAASTPNVAVSCFSAPPIGFGISNPTPISSVKISSTVISSQTPMGIYSPADHFTVRPPPVTAPMGVSFSSNTSSASTEEDDDDEEEMGFDVDLEGEPSSVAGTSRKRRRGVVKGSGSKTHKMMMEFFEGLMKEVMHKQEVMQQKFLEAMGKREQDRMIREETWKRQEMARLSREQERMAQERTISASRDAAIIAFLQKFTGQTIQLPVVNIPSSVAPHHQHQQHDVPVPMPVPVPVSVPVPLSPVPPPPLQPQTALSLQQNKKTAQDQNPPPSNTLSPLDQPMPYQEISQGGDGSAEPFSSRWPKQEVLALIKLRGGLETRYQETGPKGLLWEEISAGMQRMGYKRSAKRCKEKWENINKYFKKVKESNKKRREDSKTCPYFNELDALYRKKILGSSSGGGGSDGGGSGSRSSFSDTSKTEQDPIKNMDTKMALSTATETSQTILTEGLSASLFGEGTEEQPATSTKPEDIVNELMELHELYRPDSNNEEEYCSEDEDDTPDNDDKDKNKNTKNTKNMDYKIEFERRNAGSSNGVGNEFQSMAVVQ
ncbi:trihelix transcription factor GTL1-like isoform X1 [Cucurbita moschata]|uniref:Trihelix transcription factor GTL1-like isoform X1 n=1 Tax=Cucurbita moschata TaxID=3662 RepID=A0A6J1H0G8_CUCMO|nr:trihelix transcription factor GTL1-like isoform X1 [Cucurbita moschata]